MFGGDEVNSLVIDIGSHTVKAGYGGDDGPKAVYPSSVGALQDGDARKLLAGSQNLNFRRDGMEVVPCFGEDGSYADWDAVNALWEHAFTDRLRITDPKEHPMMLAEPTPHPDAAREKVVELMFETHGPPALYLARDAVLAAFATGRQTALVVDAGHDSTTVAAVHDGYLLHRTITRTPLGGSLLTSAMAAAAAARAGRPLAPAFAFSRREAAPGDWVSTPLDFPGTTASYTAYAVSQLAADIKETTARVNDGPFDAAANASMPTASYDLPDGTTLELGADRLNVPECMFQPRLLGGYGLGGVAEKADCRSLPDAVMATLALCDPDLRRDLLGAVVLSGGGALLTGLRDRLERELNEAAAPSGVAKVKVVSPANTVERRFGVWIGGSILASLGSFQQMWMSKAQYEEHGAGGIHRFAP